MEKVFILAILITVVFGVLRFIEMRFIDKKIKPLKFYARDIVIVFLSAAIGCTAFFHMDTSIIELFNVVTNSASSINSVSSPQIFTDEPGF